MYEIRKPAEAAYQALVRQLPDVQSLFVTAYKIPPSYEDRVAGSADADQLLKRARNRRSAAGMPFWDAVIAEAMTMGSIEESIINGALYHQHMEKNMIEIPRSKILTSGIVTCIEQAGITYPWAVLSRVRTKHRTEAHFPMLDLRCSVSDSNLVSLQLVAKRLLECPWVLIESEKSYHLIGASLMTYCELVSFLGAAILLGPLADRNYIAHQLINGSAALRIVGQAGSVGLYTRCATFPRKAW